jgi:anti-anti-sigma factor
MVQPGIVELSGRIDNVTSSSVEATLDTALDAMPSALLLDLTGVTFVSIMGLRVLLMAAKRFQRQNTGLALHSVAPQIASVFRLNGLNTSFPMHASREAALAAIQTA